MTTAFRVFLMIFPVKLYIIVALSVNACRHCQIPPFVAYATSSPGRGKSFLIGRAIGKPGKSERDEKVNVYTKKRGPRCCCQVYYKKKLHTTYAAWSFAF